MMKDDDFKLLRGFADRQTDGQTDDCRVAFATENTLIIATEEETAKTTTN